MTAAHPTIVRHDIDKFARDMGGIGSTYGTGCRRYTFPTPGARRGFLQLEVHVRGTRSTEIGMERIRGWRVDEHADPWLKENVWPYAHRYLKHTGGAGFLPTHGYYSGTSVLTGEALDLVRLWLPQELAWQAEAQREHRPVTS